MNNREIKFRARRKMFGGGQGDFVYGHYYETQNGKEGWIRQTDSISHLIHKDTLGQYTGLKDKNGVEIYEGDILQIYSSYSGLKNKQKGGKDRTRVTKPYIQGKNYRRVVKYGVTKGQNIGFNVTKTIDNVRYEVIGNIYQNKDLIK